MPMYMEGEMPTVVNTGGGYNNGFGGGFSDGWWGIILIALLFGWGRNGNGTFGGNGGGSEMLGYELGKVATTNDVANGFAQNTLQRAADDILLAQTQGFAGLNTVISNATSTIGYNMLQGFNGISSQIASCCCDLKQINLENRYLNERQTCDLITNANANTQKILDFLCTEKINALTAENAALKGRISNDAQTAAIVGALAPKQPIPAYPVFPATSFAYPSGVTFGIGGNNGCCGCGNSGF